MLFLRLVLVSALFPLGFVQAFRSVASHHRGFSMRKASSFRSPMDTDRHVITREGDPLYGRSSASFLAASPSRDSELERGPKVPWTIADLFSNPPALAVFYQSVGTSYDVGTPLGSLIGGVVVHPFSLSSSPWIQTVANGGLVCGFAGIALGAARFAVLASDADTSEMQRRRDDVVSSNVVRALDAGTYTGLAVGGIVVAAAGGPTSLGLAPGFLGLLQGLSLGAAGGSLLTMVYIGSHRLQR